MSTSPWLQQFDVGWDEMSDRIPTGKTYLGFVLTWTVALFFVWLVLIGLFASGRVVAGLLTIAVTVYGFVRHSASIGGRAKRSIRRNQPLSG